MSALGRDEDLALASLDFLGDDDDPGAQVRQQLRAEGEAGEPGRAPAGQTGADASDSIWVAVDDRGRVQAVDVSRQWRERLGVGRFADGLLEAYTDAVQRATNAAAVAALVAGPGRRQENAAPETVPQAPLPADEGEWRAAVWEALGDIDANLDRLRRLDAGGAARDSRRDTLRSPWGYLTVELRGRGIVAITGNTRLIAAADAERLRRDALAALRAVHTLER